MKVASYNIHNDTCLIPYLIAEKVTNDKEIQDKLVVKCEKMYETSEHFRLSFKNKDARQVLEMWFNHWFLSINKKGK